MVGSYSSTRWACALSVFWMLPFINGFQPSPCFTRLHSQRAYPGFGHDMTRLPVSTAPSPSTISEDEQEESSDEFTMPWSKFQEWALRDNLPRYVISIPVRTQGGGSQQKLHALWRTMSREVTELCGYPIEMLHEMHARQLKHQEDDDTALSITPEVLPLLDEFEFESSGGLSGRVYGVLGVADGTKIETTVVKDVQFTLPKGYVQTEDGAVAYELGTPLRDFYSLDGTSGTVRELSKSMVKTAAVLAKGAVANDPATVDEDPDTMLVRLGFATAVVLGGATAMSMLSHHLTVNIFWV
jgi:hypothetical protein